MSDTPITHVSDTAFMVASYRAAESARPDALFHDPLAGRLADGRGRDLAARLAGGNQVAWVVVMRTLIIDDYIREAIAAGCDTVLNLGAGLDTRPYRLALPPTLRWVEVDFAETIDFKNERLAGETPRCRLERRAVDLSDATTRAALLDDIDASSAKVLVLTEGVVGYLTNDAVAALAADLHRRPRIAHWLLEYSSAGFRKLERLMSRRRRKQMTKAPIQFEPGDWRAFFAERGWRAKEIRFFMPEAERHGRPAPISPWLNLAVRLVTLNNPSVVRENVGFALMERVAVAK